MQESIVYSEGPAVAEEEASCGVGVKGVLNVV